MIWQEIFEEKLNNGKIKTDSDIEDFIQEFKYANWKATNQRLRDFAEDVWNTFYKLRAKGTLCEGCRNVDCWGSFPCDYCSRKITPKDYYSKE